MLAVAPVLPGDSLGFGVRRSLEALGCGARIGEGQGGLPSTSLSYAWRRADCGMVDGKASIDPRVVEITLKVGIGWDELVEGAEKHTASVRADSGEEGVIRVGTGGQRGETALLPEVDVVALVGVLG